MPYPPDSSIFGGWPPTPEDFPPKTEPHGDNNPPGDNTDAPIPFWADAPIIYDTCQLGGDILPGLVQVTGANGRKLDVKQSKGVDGATITDNGSEPEEINLVLTMWTRDQWKAFQAIVPKINPSNVKGKMVPKDIVHPVLNLFSIRRVYITKIVLPQPSRLKGAMEVTISCKGWRPEPKNPVSKTSTAKKSENSNQGNEFGYVVTAEGQTNGSVNTFLGEDALKGLMPSTDPPAE